jgi:putative transposase
VDYAQEVHNLSLRGACRVVGISRTSYEYEPDTERDEPVIEELLKLAEQYPAYGFKKMFDKLRQQGKMWNHKRVYRIYKALKLHLRRKGKKRLPTRHPAPLLVPLLANQTWSVDFMNDGLMCGRRFRTFNVLDDFHREALAIVIDFSIPAQRVIRTLDQIAEEKGYPDKLRLDNGPEFISIALADWAQQHGVMLDFIQPGKPTQNSFIERFNRTYRTEVLNQYIFKGLSEVRTITEAWIKEYNEERPHQSLDGLTPRQYLLKRQPEISSFEWH